MKFPTGITAVLLSFSVAGPLAIAQNLDFDAYDSIPIAPDASAPIGLTPDPITYDPSAVASVAASAATNGALSKRQGPICTPQEVGNYPTISPDTDVGFVNDPTMALISENATTPPGFFLSEGFQNLQASASDPTYMTYISDVLTSYDPNVCAEACTSMQGCVSFNIYFERDPALYLDPEECPTSASVTRIKCAFFGTTITTADATNIGQWQDDFHVVITGSNTYTLTAPPPEDSFSGPTSLGNACINAPTSANTYMGVQTFPSTQPYDPSVCAAACIAKSAYNLRHTANTSAARLCVFFDAYIMYKNGDNGIFTCTYYTQPYDPSYATNHGQYDGEGNHYTIGHSFTYSYDGEAWV